MRPRTSLRILPLLCVALVAVATGCSRGAPPLTRFALLAGASGETVEPNFFVEDLRGFGAALGARGWNVNVVAGASDGLIGSSLKATNANLLKGVHETLSAAQPGQEALLVFHSHGREQEEYWGQRSHSIVSEERNPDSSEPGFDLDSIEPELVQAQRRGVTVALVDLSCYSGSTLEIQGTACEISLASSRYVSLCSGRKEERHFNARFFQLPPPGVTTNLESQFFEARGSDHESINLPQISSRATPLLKAWERFLVSVDPLDTFEDLKDLHTGTPPFDAKTLLNPLDQWIADRPAGFAQKLHGLREEIARRLNRVLTLRKQLEAQMPALARDYDDRSITLEVPGRRPLTLGPAYLAELLQAVQDDHVPDSYSDAQRGLVKAVAPLHGALAVRFSGPLQAYQQRRDRFDHDTEAFAQAADGLFEYERKIYELQPESPGRNRCREFTL